MEKSRKIALIMGRETEYCSIKSPISSEEKKAELRKMMTRSESGRAILQKEEIEERMKKEREKRDKEIRSYTPSVTVSVKQKTGISGILSPMVEDGILPKDIRMRSVMCKNSSNVCVRLTKEQRKQIENLAIKWDMSKSCVIRIFVEIMLENISEGKNEV